MAGKRGQIYGIEKDRQSMNYEINNLKIIVKDEVIDNIKNFIGQILNMRQEEFCLENLIGKTNLQKYQKFMN